MVEISIDLNKRSNRRSLMFAVTNKWNKAVVLAAPAIQKELRSQLITGGGAMIPFNKTLVWTYMHQPGILAELGFMSLKPFDDLLDALRSTIDVYTSRAKRKMLVINMFSLSAIAGMTIHPSAGTGQLGEVSWFVDWVVRGRPIRRYDFKTTGPPVPRSSRLAGPEAGLMVPARGGFWSIPPFKDDILRWLDNNGSHIKSLIISQIRKAVKRV